MKGMLSLAAAAAMLATPAVQAQDADIVFRPAGQWTADYGNDYCRLIRNFSDGERQFSLALERLQPGAQVRMIVVGEGMRPFRGAEQIAYAFQPTGASGKARYVRSDTADGKQFVSFDPVTLAQLTFTPGAPPPMYNRAQEVEAARGITGFILTEGLISPVRVETGSLGAPVAALQTCVDDLIGSWGLDAEKYKTMTMGPIPAPNPSGVLPQGTIPFSEFGKFGGGANQVRLLIGADGKVTSCAIYSPSLSQTLNDKICNLARERASFIPAKDASGQPMASMWMGSPLFLGAPPPGGRRGGPFGDRPTETRSGTIAEVPGPPVNGAPGPDNPSASAPAPSTPAPTAGS